VAIKVLHAAVAAKADVVQRFEREAQAAGRIGSEHIVEVLDLGNLPDGERFMVMEYLEGESLGDRIKKRKRLAPHEAAPSSTSCSRGSRPRTRRASSTAISSPTTSTCSPQAAARRTS
jgi:serine/threonine protein kinase